MKSLARTALIVVTLLLSTGLVFAADKTTNKVAPAAASGKDADAKAPAKSGPVDINTATDAELKAIPGVGDAFAAKIIAGRPYANKTQLKSRKILPVPLYEQIKDRLIAKQPAASAKAADKPAGKK